MGVSSIALNAYARHTMRIGTMAHALASKVKSLRVRTVRVPLQPPHRTSSGTVAESPLVLTDATTDDGLVGHSMVFTYTPAALKPPAELIRNFAPFAKHEPP